VAGGEVVIELTIDRDGAPTRPVVLRTTPPYTQMMLDAVMQWQFTPARALNVQGARVPVEGQVLVVAVYRPPSLLNGPTLGEPPVQLSPASADVASPSAIVPPVYPVKSLGQGVMLFELLIDEQGRVAESAALAATAGFEEVSRDALRQWTFNPARYRGRPAAASTYVLFGFMPPLGPFRR
jgi:outer membrane biosynthesis protein TonB